MFLPSKPHLFNQRFLVQCQASKRIGEIRISLRIADIEDVASHHQIVREMVIFLDLLRGYAVVICKLCNNVIVTDRIQQECTALYLRACLHDRLRFSQLRIGSTFT